MRWGRHSRITPASLRTSRSSRSTTITPRSVGSTPSTSASSATPGSPSTRSSSTSHRDQRGCGSISVGTSTIVGTSGAPRRHVGLSTGRRAGGVAAIFDTLSRHCPPDAVICVDLGNNTYSFGRYFETSGQDVLMSGYLGSIGFGYPAAIGAWAAAPERPIVAATGDGGFGEYMGGDDCGEVRHPRQTRAARQRRARQDQQRAARRRIRRADVAAQSRLRRLRHALRRSRHRRRRSRDPLSCIPDPRQHDVCERAPRRPGSRPSIRRCRCRATRMRSPDAPPRQRVDLGSVASRRPSPTKLTHRATTASDAQGYTTSHQ